MEMDEKFLSGMKKLLGEEYDSFIEAIQLPATKALRVNTLKLTCDEFSALCPMPLQKNPFSDDGFIYDSEIFLAGLSPFHHAGLYYIQEPSTFVAVEYLKPYIGKRVLDLCAAPGGKASYIASLLDSDTAFIANDVEYTRAKVLSQNFERLGIKNSLVTSNPPYFFAENYPEYFDTIIVDAPCSGEGMMRKSDQAIYNWSEKNVATCFIRQSQILNSAAEALCIGGHLLYSTCTLNTTENEETVKRFLATHDFEIVPVPPHLKNKVRSGYGIEAARVFPQDGGEGHFCCLMKKISGEGDYPFPKFKSYPILHGEKERQVRDILLELSEIDYGELSQKDNAAIAFGGALPIVEGLTVLRAGLKVADIGENHTTPAHALAMTLFDYTAKKNVDFPFFSNEIRDYLAGNVIHSPAPFSGYGTISLSGYCTGLIKSVDDMIKNHYPKGLRFFTK